MDDCGAARLTPGSELRAAHRRGAVGICVGVSSFVVKEPDHGPTTRPVFWASGLSRLRGFTRYFRPGLHRFRATVTVPVCWCGSACPSPHRTRRLASRSVFTCERSADRPPGRARLAPSRSADRGCGLDLQPTPQPNTIIPERGSCKTPFFGSRRTFFRDVSLGVWGVLFRKRPDSGGWGCEDLGWAKPGFSSVLRKVTRFFGNTVLYDFVE